MPLSNEELIAKIHHCTDGVLDLMHSGIDREGARALAQALKETQVHTLNLWNNNIGPEGARALAQALKETQVHTLDLSWNDIGPEGAQALAQALKGTSVHTLALCNNYIGSDGAQTLGQSLKGTSVHTLELCGNQILDKGAQALAQALKEASVHTLKLRNNGIGYIGPSGVEAFALILKGTSVHTLELDDNYIGPKGTQALAQTVKGTLLTTLKTNFHSSQLSNTLRENLSAKKSTMITLGQLSARGKFPPDLIDLIASFLPQACEPNHERAIATIEASAKFSNNKAAAQVIQRAWARHRLFRQPTIMDTEHAITATNAAQSKTNMFRCAVM